MLPIMETERKPADINDPGKRKGCIKQRFPVFAQRHYQNAGIYNSDITKENGIAARVIA